MWYPPTSNAQPQPQQMVYKVDPQLEQKFAARTQQKTAVHHQPQQHMQLQMQQQVQQQQQQMQQWGYTASSRGSRAQSTQAVHQAQVQAQLRSRLQTAKEEAQKKAGKISVLESTVSDMAKTMGKLTSSVQEASSRNEALMQYATYLESVVAEYEPSALYDCPAYKATGRVPTMRRPKKEQKQEQKQEQRKEQKQEQKKEQKTEAKTESKQEAKKEQKVSTEDKDEAVKDRKAREAEAASYVVNTDMDALELLHEVVKKHKCKVSLVQVCVSEPKMVAVRKYLRGKHTIGNFVDRYKTVLVRKGQDVSIIPNGLAKLKEAAAAGDGEATVKQADTSVKKERKTKAKTKPCNLFNSARGCRHGDDCSYLHILVDKSAKAKGQAKNTAAQAAPASGASSDATSVTFSEPEPTGEAAAPTRRMPAARSASAPQVNDDIMYELNEPGDYPTYEFEMDD